MTAERADVRWRRLSHLVWRGWSSLELSWLGLRLQKSCWTLSRLIQERAATVGTGPHPGWGSREEVQLFGLLLLWLLKSHRTELCLDCTVCSCNPNRLLMKALCKSNFRIMMYCLVSVINNFTKKYRTLSDEKWLLSCEQRWEATHNLCITAYVQYLLCCETNQIKYEIKCPCQYAKTPVVKCVLGFSWGDSVSRRCCGQTKM